MSPAADGVVDGAAGAGVVAAGWVGCPRSGDRAASTAAFDGGPFKAGRTSVGSSAATAAVAPASRLTGYWRQSLWSLGESPPVDCTAAAGPGAKAAVAARARAIARDVRDWNMDPRGIRGGGFRGVRVVRI